MRKLYAALAGAVLGLACNVNAQTLLSGSLDATLVQSAPDSIVQVTAEAQGLSLMAPEDLPRSGTFWLVTSNGVMAPMPCPLMDANFPTYFMADGQFLVDGTGGQVAVNTRRLGLQTSTVAALSAQQTAIVNLINQVQEAQFNREFAMAMGMEVPMPGDGGGSGGGVSPNGLLVSVDYGTNLWIAQVANGKKLLFALT